jgi:phosphatidylcholine synthase
MNRDFGQLSHRTRMVAAFGVHLFTSIGVVIAMFAIFAAVEGRWIDMFIWLGVALIVDGIDGPIARHLNLAQTLPRWSGDVLDLVVDYLTYIFIPAIAVLKAGLVAEPFALPAVIAILISGAIYYSDRWMKTGDDYFRGFPAFWNMVVFYLFLFRPDPSIVLAMIAVFVILTFLPIYFIHPFRTQKWMGFNMTIAVCWLALSAVTLLYDFDPPVAVSILLSLIAVYYLLAGLARPPHAVVDKRP